MADSDVGPDRAPPSLPTGWIAQWDATSRKYYFVQISTGVSTWETPTTEAPTVPTPGSTPAQPHNPYSMPPEQNNNSEAATKGFSSQNGEAGQEGERGLGSLAVNALLHSNKPYGQQQQSQSGLGGLASSLLGGSHSTQSGGSSGSGSLVGQLAGSLLGGNKPHNQQQQQQQQSSSNNSSSGMFGNLLGGHSSTNQSGYGYSTTGSSNGVYNGQAPPTAYQPGTGHQSQSSQYNSGSQYGGGSQYNSPAYGQYQQYSQTPSQTPPNYGQSPQNQYSHQASHQGQYNQHQLQHQGGFGQHQGHYDPYSENPPPYQSGGYGQQPPPPPIGSHPSEHHPGHSHGAPSAYGQQDQYGHHASDVYNQQGPVPGAYGGGYTQGGNYGQQNGGYNATNPQWR